MDFFEAQARAKKRTGRLVALFTLAVIGTICVGYVFALMFLAKTGGRSGVVQPDTFAVVTVGTLIVVAVGAAFKWAQYSAGGSAVAESVGARRVETNTTDLAQRRLLNVVEEMSIASGVPVPAVYVIDDEPGINAFAAGLTTHDAVVTVTSGTLQKLNREELQGVIGHEFSHILNGDMRLNMRIGALVFGILVIGLAGRGILWGLGRGRVRVSSRGKGGGNAVIVIFAVGLGLMIVGYTGYFFGRLIQAAVSRQREFLADASSVQFTRNPGGIVNALRKIGGYALGSSMQTAKSAEIGHFFFAQAFRSNFGGLWATHPQLDERIKAIDPRFDGKYVEPPGVVDVGHESWSRPGQPGNAAGFAPGAVASSPFFKQDLKPRSAQAIVGTAGSVTPEQLGNARKLLESVPESLRAAARTADGAIALSCALLLSEEPALRARQLGMILAKSGAAAESAVRALGPDLRGVDGGLRLPLLQLALPSLKQVPEAGLEPFFSTLDELVHADDSVSPFEFALQKMILHGLDVGKSPSTSVVQIYSFNAVVHEIAVVLSALARVGSSNDTEAQEAFNWGATELRMIRDELALLPPAESNLEKLDAALDKLATASLIIKQRTLVAAAHTSATDGVLALAEAELLRAIAATLDVPIPA